MKTTLLIISIVCLVVAVYATPITPEQEKKAEDHATVCVKETGATAEAVKQLKSGVFDHKDDKTKCFAKCFFQKSGFMNEKGEFQEGETVKKLSIGDDKEKVEKLVGKCKITSGTDACDNAFKMYECFSKEKKQL